MKTFDVFLKDRITKMDIIIHTLSMREDFSFYEKLLLDFALLHFSIFKNVQGASSAVLDARLKELYATIHTLAETDMVLDVSAVTAAKCFASAKADLFLQSGSLGLFFQCPQVFQSAMTLSARLDSIEGNLSLGTAGFMAWLGVNRPEMKKTAYVPVVDDWAFSARVDLAGKKVLFLESARQWMVSSPVGVFYLTLLSGETEMCLLTSALSKVDYCKALAVSPFFMELFAGVQVLSCRKSISGDSVLLLSSSIAAEWGKVVCLQETQMFLSCSVNMGILRRRLLKEMDSFSLEVFDADRLRDVDYIEVL